MKDLRGQEVKKITQEDVLRIKSYFLNNDIRMYALFIIGINMGLRISDLIKLKFEDITPEKKVYLIEKKTQKKKMIKFNKGCQKMVKILEKEYTLQEIIPNGYLFKSYYRKFTKNRIDRHLSIVSVNKSLNTAKNNLNIPYPIGTHSMRKTWAYMVYNGEKEIGIVMEMLNHSSEKQTLTYIRADEDKYEKIYDKYILGFGG